MKKPRKNSLGASTLQIALSSGLIPLAAILLAVAAPTNTKEVPPRHDSHEFQLVKGAAAESTTALGNYPNTSVLLSGDTTVAPDVAPTNTTSINVSASTNFKGTFAASPTTGVVTVTDSHPAGTYTVTVRAFNGGSPTATKTFTLTVTTPAFCTPFTFAAAANFGVGSASVPYSVAVGDFNGDGRQDLATANGSSNLSILLGDGAGNFGATTNFAAGFQPYSAAVGDFNGDGKQDLAAANFQASGTVSVLLGDGTGNFSAATAFGAGSYPQAVAVGDFNGDGKQDLVAANAHSDNVSVLLGDGAGSFSAATNFGVGSIPYFVAVGDFNSDGKQDLAVANAQSANVSILLGNGAGSFGAATNFGVGSDAVSVAVGDFNGDGKQDLAVSKPISNEVAILLGNGAGGFSGASTFPSGGDNPQSVAVGDFNGDGKQDVAVANRGSNNVSALLGNGAGNFSAGAPFAVGSNPTWVAVGDFNGDGRQDLATSNAGSNNVSILIRPPCPPPTPTPTATATASPTPTATATGTPPPLPTLGNYPNTSVMLSTNATVTPDTAPANTTSITISTSTNFEGTLEGNPATGVVRVTDAHPAGTYTVTVRAFNGGGPVAIATRTFTLTVTPPAACPTMSFAAGVNFCIGNNPKKVAVGDFNGDGKQDIAVANSITAGFVSILLGDGAGYFSVGTNFSVGNSPSAVAVGDFNGDGKQDLAVPNGGSNNVSILLGDGAGHFGAPTNFGAGGPGSVVVGDFNGDGKQDLAMTNGGSDSVLILLGDGAGNFSAPTTFAAGDGPNSVGVGDFNSDGRQDLVVTDDNSNSVSILLGDGTGNFILFTNLPVGTHPYSPTVGDFNGDGRQDIAVSNFSSATASILLGDGAGHFSTPTDFGLGGNAFSLQVGDFNGDGKQDLVAAKAVGPNGVSILLGDGAGNFGAPLHFPGGSGPYSVAVGDFNGDGRQDFVLGNPLNNVSILLRSCPGEPTPTPTPTATATGTPPPPPTLGNYPDTSILLSTDTSVSPNAPPANTTSINVSTSTSFEGTLEGDPNTGVIRITDAHPAGTYTVTVTAFNGSGATASRTFTLTVTTPPTCNPVAFAAGNLSVGAPYSVATGDFNRDGKQDLAVINNGGFASILLGDGAGNFSAPTNFSVANHIESVAVGDFNGDGRQDLAVTEFGTDSSCQDRGSVWVLLGDGSGNFSAGTNVRDGINPRSVAVGDFNNDGRQDLAVANGSSDNVSIFLGDGAGNFSALRNFAAGDAPVSVAVGDFNRDGSQDLAVANANSFTVSILLGDGAGHFGTPTTLGAGALPYSVAVGDFTGDGKQDLAVANYGTNNVSIFLGDGAGNFSAATNFLADCGPYSVAVGDLNGDGKQDLAVANGCPQNPGNVSILLGDGTGTFSLSATFATGNLSRSVAVGDFTGDGKQDLAVANLSSNDVSILLRSCAPTPTATPTATATISPCPPVITQSTSQAINASKEPCRYGNTGGFAQTPNSYWRAFNMGTFVGGAEYTVSSVSFGVSAVSYIGSSPPPVTVRLYANTGASFPGGTRTLLGSSTITVTAGQGGTVVTTPLVATVPAGTPELVMELFTPDGIANRYLFYVGGNLAPETGLSYWSSLCNSTPEVISSHLVFNVYGTCTAPAPTATPSPTATPCGTLLYDQTNSAGGTTVSQNFEPANDGFDSQLADDFVVPAGPAWTIQRVNVSGAYFSGSGLAASVNVSFYFNSGTLPGAAVPGGIYTNLPMTDTAGNFSIALPTNLVLTAGTYWVSVQANMDFTLGGEWGWVDRTVQSNSPAAWQNPGGGFGFGCLTWGARAATCGVDSTAPDQIFQIVGCLGVSSPTPSPTATATATATSTPTSTVAPTQTPTFTPTPTPTPTVSPTPSPSPSATPAAQPLNLSTRMLVQIGDNVGIGGFIITPSTIGSGPTGGKQVVLRAIGPSLTQFGVPNALVDPVLELHGPAGFTTISNDNWRDTQETELIGTGLAPTHNLESAILTTLDPGAYTAIVSGKTNSSGVALIEVYDLTQAAASKLGNISTRAFVSTGSSIVIAGFILGGHGGEANVILRGIGPSLAGFGVPDALANPTLELRDSNGALIRENDNWEDDPAQAALISAAGLAPTHPLESAVATTLPPGQYTALLAGLNGTTGVGLVEVYDRGTP
jgi:hypothetical protein